MAFQTRGALPQGCKCAPGHPWWGGVSCPLFLKPGQQPSRGEAGKGPEDGLRALGFLEKPPLAAERSHTPGCKSLLDILQLLGKLDGLDLALPRELK